MPNGSRKGICLAIFPLITFLEGIHLDGVIVPFRSVVGETAKLTCSYHLDEEMLYSVKWYKGGHELFRYRPKNDPPMQLFELPGVHVDRDASNEKELVLNPLTLKAAGGYRCEVSEEGTFFTVSDKADLYIVDLPDRDPVITGLHPAYSAGHYVRANCTSPNSFPEANISWHINDEEVSDKFQVHYPVLEKGELRTSVLGLSFQIRPHQFRNGQLKISCRARIPPYYDRTQAVVLSEFAKKTPVVTMLESRNSRESSAADPASAVWMNVVIDLLLVIV